MRTLELSLRELETKVVEIEQRDAEVRRQVNEYGRCLTALCKRSATYFSGSDFTVEETGEPAEEIYGHLWVSGSGFYLAHRTRWDDFIESDWPEEQNPGAYTLTVPDAWDARWLRTIATEDNLRSFADCLYAHLGTILEGRSATVERMHAALPLNPGETHQALIQVAKTLDFPKVLDGWRRATRDLARDPSAAATSALVLLETTLKHIIDRGGFPMPGDQTVLPLYKSVQRGLGNWDKLHTERHKIAQGLSTLVDGLRTLRTNMGDAHGKGPAQQSLADHDTAQLAVTASGAVSTFLMRQFSEFLRKQDTR